MINYYFIGALGISGILNIFLLWYVWRALKKLLFVSDNISYLHEAMNGFSEHLINIHELEMFYGDETLKSLIDHSKGLKEIFNEFEDVHSLTDIQEEYVDDSDDLSLPANIIQGDIYGRDPTKEEEIDTSQEKKIQGKTILYTAS